MAPTGNCRKCGKPAKFKCSGCHEVFYCCTQHQKQDWLSQHKLECRNYEVKFSEKLGYHLVSLRDIKVNDVILTELPLALGPSHRKRQKVYCIGCNLQVIHFPAGHTFSMCPGCYWMTCSPDCPGLKDPARHAEECAILKKQPVPISKMVQSPAQILIFRCFLVQRRNPEKWKMMKEMGERAIKERDEKVSEGVANAFENLAFDTIINNGSGHFEDFSMSTIKKIYALLDIYGIWLGSPADRHLVGFYGSASLLQQDCLPNTALCFEAQPTVVCYKGTPFRGRVAVRAIKNIKKGEILTVIRGVMPHHSMFCTMGRLNEFLYMRGLRCKCPRCVDPTELGLHTSTVKCSKCSGWVLPINPSKIEETDWRCTGACGRRLNGDTLRECLTNMASELDKPFTLISEDALTNLLKKYERHLHPRHNLCLDVKSRLAAFYGVSFTGEGHVTNMTKFTNAQLKTRQDVCKDALASLEIIGPTTDVVAERYASCLLTATRIEIELLKRKFEAGSLIPEEAAKSIVECRANLRRPMVILRFGTNNEVRSCLVGQAAFDDRALMEWAKEKDIKLVSAENVPAL